MIEKEFSQTLICPVCGNLLHISPDNPAKYCSYCGERINHQTDLRKIRNSSYPYNYLLEEDDGDSLDIRDMEEVYGAPPWEKDERLEMWKENDHPEMRTVYGAPPWKKDERLEMWKENDHPEMRTVYGAPPHRRNIIARLIDWIICR